RELAIQIAKDAEVLGAHTGLRTGVVFGGTGYDTQRHMLERGLEILVGTPGRLIDYFKQRIFSLHGVQVAVLDEADRMFDLGFIKDIRYLLRRMPPPEERQSMLFSATLTFRVAELAYEHMNNPETVSVAPDKRTADQVKQLLYHVGSDEKLSLMIGLFRRELPARTLVFVNTKRTADIVEATLRVNGIEAETLSGDVPQRKRQRLIGQFANGEIACIVATDVAARGLHIPDVSHVVNYDLPQNAEDYVHRIGRTARAGASGDAISLACEQYVFSLQEIQEYLGHPIPTAEIDDELLVATKSPGRVERRRPPGPRKGGRGQPRRSTQRSRG
ncbi:MAG: DEAD/DEAH box helicase, partial [Gammaproteobacteria bacterium]|nr:DEAD/DEAH box helicase [Gammaproteobacteria bacterium]